MPASSTSSTAGPDPNPSPWPSHRRVGEACSPAHRRGLTARAPPVRSLPPRPPGSPRAHRPRPAPPPPWSCPCPPAPRRPRPHLRSSRSRAPPLPVHRSAAWAASRAPRRRPWRRRRPYRRPGRAWRSRRSGARTPTDSPWCSAARRMRSQRPRRRRVPGTAPPPLDLLGSGAVRMAGRDFGHRVPRLEAVALRGHASRTGQQCAQPVEVDRSGRGTLTIAGQCGQLVAAKSVFGRLCPHALAPRRQRHRVGFRQARGQRGLLRRLPARPLLGLQPFQDLRAPAREVREHAARHASSSAIPLRTGPHSVHGTRARTPARRWAWYSEPAGLACWKIGYPCNADHRPSEPRARLAATTWV